MASKYNETRSQAERGNNKLMDLLFARFKGKLSREFKKTYQEAFNAYDKNGRIPKKLFADHQSRVYDILFDVNLRSMMYGSERLLRTFLKVKWTDKKKIDAYLKAKKQEFAIQAGNRAKLNAKYIADTSEKEITGIIKQAVEKKSILGDKLKELLIDAESRSIFRTIVVGFTNIHGSLNFGQRESAKDNQDPEYDYYKIWVTEKDEKVRSIARGSEFDHVAMEGVAVLEEKKFFVTKEWIDGPGDWDNASIGNVINCRCFLRHKRERK
jgi:hypothetical protein